MLDATTRALRRGKIGSSDASVVVGVDPWRSPADLWAELTGRVRGRNIDDDPAVRTGTFLEHGLVAWAEHLLGAPVTRDVFVEHPSGIAVANLDGLGWTDPASTIVEAKAIGIVAAPRYLDEFGEDATDVVPAHTMVQVQHQFACLRENPEHRHVRRALVVTVLRNRGLVPFWITRDDAFCDALMEDEAQFMHDFVRADRMPPGPPPTLDTLAAWQRVHDLPATPIAPERLQAWLDARDVLALARKDEELAKRELLAALGDADVGDAGPVLGRVTYFESSRAGFVVEPTTYRTLRHHAPRPARTSRKRNPTA